MPWKTYFSGPVCGESLFFLRICNSHTQPRQWLQPRGKALMRRKRRRDKSVKGGLRLWD